MNVSLFKYLFFGFCLSFIILGFLAWEKAINHPQLAKKIENEITDKSSFESKLKLLNAEIENLNFSQKLKENFITQLETAKQELEEKLKAKILENESQTKRNSDLLNEIQENNNIITGLQDDISRLGSQISKLEQTIKTLNEEKEKLLKDIETLNLNMETLKIKTTHEKEDLLKKLSEKNKEIKPYQDKIDELNKELEKLKLDLKSKEKELDQEKKSHAITIKIMVEGTNAFKQTNKLVDELKEKIKQIEEEKEKLLSALMEKDTLTAKLHGEKKQLEEEIENLKKTKTSSKYTDDEFENLKKIIKTQEDLYKELDAKNTQDVDDYNKIVEEHNELIIKYDLRKKEKDELLEKLSSGKKFDIGTIEVDDDNPIIQRYKGIIKDKDEIIKDKELSIGDKNKVIELQKKIILHSRTPEQFLYRFKDNKQFDLKYYQEIDKSKMDITLYESDGKSKLYTLVYIYNSDENKYYRECTHFYFKDGKTLNYSDYYNMTLNDMSLIKKVFYNNERDGQGSYIDFVDNIDTAFKPSITNRTYYFSNGNTGKTVLRTDKMEPRCVDEYNNSRLIKETYYRPDDITPHYAKECDNDGRYLQTVIFNENGVAINIVKNKNWKP